jgi:poly-gamma-glutamate synthesis protein (capsule biosynthesis protein)
MKRPITLAIAGDVMLGRLVNETIADNGFAYPWGGLLPVTRDADLFLINLECTLTSSAAPWRDDDYKMFYFRADPAVVATLKLGGVDFASLANNHAGDYGAEGLLETTRVLDQAGIAHAGAGRDRAAAAKPALLTAEGCRVAVLAFADQPPEWAASDSEPGINHIAVSTTASVFDPVREAIAAARAAADVVVFSIHWGPNMRDHPVPHFRDFARRVIDAGADVFWGHSAHVVQGVEFRNGKPILYDTGDFVDDYAIDTDLRNDLSALFVVHISPPDVERVEATPVRIDNMQVNVACGRDRDWFVERFSTFCAEMGTDVVTQPDRTALVIRPGGADE